MHTRTATAQRGGPPTIQVGRPLWAVLVVITPAIATAQGSGTVDAPARLDPLANRAVVTFMMNNGSVDSALAGATVSVTRRAGLSVTGPFAAPAAPGSQHVFSHQVTNRGTDADVVRLAASAPLGWTVSFYEDVDGNGVISSRGASMAAAVVDRLLPTSLALAAGATANVLVVVDVPMSAPDGSIGLVTVTLTSTADARATVSATDRITVAAVLPPRPGISLAKTVNRADATIGDTLRYTIAFINNGDGDAVGSLVLDTLPRGLRYLAGSMMVNGLPLTDAGDADSGSSAAVAGGRTLVRVAPGTIAPAAGGTITLSAIVDISAVAGPMSNLATMDYGDPLNTTVLTASSAAITRIATAALTLTDRIIGAPRVVVGTVLHFQLSYANQSATAARNAVLTDTLPAELAFVSSTGATVNGQVLTWTLGMLDVGAAGTIDLHARVVGVPAADTVADNAVLTADNAIERAAHATATVVAFAATDLHIAKTAAVLEASIGDAIPYAIELTNVGPAVLRGIVLHDHLPEGLNYSATGSTGTDSMTVNGRDLVFYLTAPLAAGATATVHYAAVVATPAAGAALENRAVATAEDGLVQSDTAVAVVTQRRTFAMRERAMIGKVWLDRNDDGVQQEGEEGVAGVQVWDANGEVVTTDKEGRYSFRNVAAGTHALRLDPMGIPRDFLLASREDEVVMVQADGWTLPRTSIRLVPRAGIAAAPACSCKSAAATSGANVMLAGMATSAPLAAAAIQPPSITPLMTRADRAAMARRELITGPTAHMVLPLDGTVLDATRFYAGVRGAPGAYVRVYDGSTLLRSATLRADGVQDFVNMELSAGPHVLRVAMDDAAGREHWDSIAVHVSGAPAAFDAPKELQALRGDAPQAMPVRVKVLDRWRVPVATTSMITVTARGATIDAADADPSSVGVQLRTDAAGYVTIPLRAGHAVGKGELRLTAGKAQAIVPLGIFASVRPLMATGVAQLGFGAAPTAFAAVTVQGALTEETSVTVSYDSRRTEGNDFFQRGFDPLGDDQVPTYGDNSQSRVLAPSSKSLSARLERGMSWLAAGDVQTLGFGRDGELGAYRRSITGMSGQVGTGALTWSGFGTVTHQALERRQLRGDGSTGPYLVGADIRPGTEQIAIEVRARENAARVMATQPLTRTTDYQVDYGTGVVLLRLPIPATDPYGNPVFLVATVERLTGGAAHLVGGLRVDADMASAMRLGTGVVDSLMIGLSGIRDGSGGTSAPLLAGASAATNLLNADFRLRRGGLMIGGGVLTSQSTDSSGMAASATARYALADDRFTLDGHWMSVGAGLGAADPRLRSPLEEIGVGISGKLGKDASLRLHHDRSHFSEFGVDRSNTGLTAQQVVGGRKITQELGFVSESMGGASGASSAMTARLSTAINSRLDTWVDGSRSFATTPSALAVARPNQVGAGLTLSLPVGLKLEASRRLTQGAGDSVAYGVTSAQLKADGVLGSQIWTGFEESSAGLNDEVRAAHSALFGWSQRLPLGTAWQVSSMFEKRIGLSRAQLVSPDRALPFAQVEQDRWSAAAGLSWMPGGDEARFAFNGEMQRGQITSGARLQLTGDAALNAGLAVITLHDWSSRRDLSRVGDPGESRADRSLLGLAMRPVTTDRFNMLAKLEWRRTTNAVGSALLSSSGRDLRLIGATDAVWAMTRRTEVSVRYALRNSTADIAGDSGQRVHLTNHFGGARLEQRLIGGLRVRGDARLLLETASGTEVWNAAPSAVYDFQGRVLLEGGYRFGALRDPDFAAVGGQGAFATVGIRLTENVLASPAAFWRDRITNDR
jgi:uncharacterized repeat protein (TIGR01451 family)